MPAHGTLAAWNVHQRNNEPQCDDCKRARADYMREYRYRTGRTKRMLVPVPGRSTQ